MGIYEYFVSEPKQMQIDTFTSQIASIMLVCGYGIAVIMVLYIGIRYSIARPSEKAQLKTQLTYLAIGTALLASGTTILGFVVGVFNNMF